MSCVVISDDECKKITSSGNEPKTCNINTTKTNSESNGDLCSTCPEANCKISSKCIKDIQFYDAETPKSKYV